MDRNVCPCKDCDKHAGCNHGNCKAYLDWKKAYTASQQKEREERAKQAIYNNYKINAVSKTVRLMKKRDRKS
jgi:hypothetical protein